MENARLVRALAIFVDFSFTKSEWTDEELPVKRPSERRAWLHRGGIKLLQNRADNRVSSG
jgi:hypothetical protein